EEKAPSVVSPGGDAADQLLRLAGKSIEEMTDGRPRRRRQGVEEYQPRAADKQFYFDRGLDPEHGWLHGLSETEIDEAADRHFAQFFDHHKKHGTQYVDWPAGWRTGVRRIPQFAGGRRANGEDRG